MKMNYLLGITVGPVQSYIEESRKLIDLYNSSRIISDIMKQIHTNILPEFTDDYELIYPNYKDVKNMDYSNYMIFGIQDLVDLHNIQDNVYKKFSKIFDKKIQDKKIVLEMKEKFHLFWAIEEIKDDNYAEAYKKLTWLLSSLKNTYEFEQVAEEGKKKCLMCGKKNIVTENLVVNKIREYKLNGDEDLCSSCLFKRIYNELNKNCKDSRVKFNSIYSIAIENWKENKDNKEHINKIKITQNLKELFIEEDKYYNPNEIDNIIKILEIKYRLKNKGQLRSSEDKKIKKSIDKKIQKIKYEFKDKVNLIENITKLKTIKETMNSIYNTEDKEKKVELPNYEYCFIQFDIDNLGRWISGMYLENKKELKSFQKKLSNILVKFGEKLNKELKYTNCDVIYSGGDDFLGILPNEDIIKVIEIIDRLFSSEVRDKLKDYTNYCRQITYSMSITIAQCKDPMSYALSKTRIELENVKKRYENKDIGKNGMAINYIINNGKEITCYLQKEDIEDYFKLIKDYKKVRSDLSFSYINNFENEFLWFNYADITHEEFRNFCSIVRCELKRLMIRSKLKNDDNRKEIIEKYINSMVDFMVDIVHKNKTEPSSNHEYIDFKNVTNIMKIFEKFSSVQFDLINDGDGEKCELN